VKRRRRGFEVFNLSFLDVVSCGFGAVILLLVMAKVAEPRVIEQISADLSGSVMKLEQEIHDLRGETAVLNRELAGKQEQLSSAKERLARLQGDLSRILGEFASSRQDAETQSTIEGQLARAKQRLSEEMKRLQAAGYRRPAAGGAVGGVPVDSEYIIFIIDTSGSMQSHAWRLVRKKIAQVLDIYPHVKGIQVMNDMGDYMFEQYSGRWIPDTPARRKAILQRLESWRPFSNSSPVEGIEAAIRRYWSRDKRISLYVFGDEFSTGTMEAVIREVDRINRADASGRRRVRIHAIGFPVGITQQDLAQQGTGIRFAALMRELTRRNGGAFVGLNSSTP